jgi:hypothetical protein
MTDVNTLVSELPEDDRGAAVRRLLDGGDDVDDVVTVSRLVSAVKASDGSIALAGRVAGSSAGWVYYVDRSGSFRAWVPGTFIRGSDEAKGMLREDLAAERLDVIPVVAADQPTPVPGG